MAELREIHYSGNVQGVGFRATVHSVASGLAVTGYVRNLSDGRVQLVAEGSASELNLLHELILERMNHHISDCQCDVRPATANYQKFEIRY